MLQKPDFTFIFTFTFSKIVQKSGTYAKQLEEKDVKMLQGKTWRIQENNSISDSYFCKHESVSNVSCASNVKKKSKASKIHNRNSKFEVSSLQANGISFRS